MRNISECSQIEIEIKETKLQNLENNQWLVIVPHEEVITQKCNNEMKNVLINGTYLIELGNNNCQILFKNHKVLNHQNLKVKYKNIEIPKLINTDNLVNDANIKLKPIKLENINLDDMNNIQNMIDTQKQRIKEIEIPSIHYDNISVWIIFCYILIIILPIIVVCYLKNKGFKFHLDQQDEDNLELSEIRLPDPISGRRL